MGEKMTSFKKSQLKRGFINPFRMETTSKEDERRSPQPETTLHPTLTLPLVDRRTANRRRWAHLFPMSNDMHHHTDSYEPNWLSLSEPAMLPLTSDYFPNAVELEKD